MMFLAMGSLLAPRKDRKTMMAAFREIPAVPLVVDLGAIGIAIVDLEEIGEAMEEIEVEGAKRIM